MWTVNPAHRGEHIAIKLGCSSRTQIAPGSPSRRDRHQKNGTNAYE
jgi:hypothetical protein